MSPFYRGKRCRLILGAEGLLTPGIAGYTSSPRDAASLGRRSEHGVEALTRASIRRGGRAVTPSLGLMSQIALDPTCRLHLLKVCTRRGSA